MLLLADANVYDFNSLLDDFFFAEGNAERFESLDEHPGRVVANVGSDEIEGELLLAEWKLKLAPFIGKRANGSALDAHRGAGKGFTSTSIYYDAGEGLGTYPAQEEKIPHQCNNKQSRRFLGAI